MTYTEFIINATNYYGAHRRDERFGQAVYNCLAKARPEIASALFYTDLDPFYKDSVSDEVWSFIRDRW